MQDREFPYHFILAGIVALFAALCYAEFASLIPISGSAYSYAYVTLGEFAAWMMGCRSNPGIPPCSLYRCCRLVRLLYISDERLWTTLLFQLFTQAPRSFTILILAGR
jgi:amino acid transporter